MMDKTQAAVEMRSTFKYQGERVENWRILKTTDLSGKRVGDCEDFSLSTLWLIAGGSFVKFWWYLVTFQAVIWYVKSAGNGVGHAELWFRGEWIDNIGPEWTKDSKHHKRFPYLWPLVIVKLLTGGWPAWKIVGVAAAIWAVLNWQLVQSWMI